MNVDSFIDGLSAEAGEAVRGLLRQAYDSGYREALASTGQPAVPAPAEPLVPPTSAPVATPVPARVEWVGRTEEDPDDATGDEGDEGEDDDGAEEAPAPRPILANPKIGTLRRRIIRTFDLERFDIDVLICRSGDPERRQLRSSARLALYRRKEGSA